MKHVGRIVAVIVLLCLCWHGPVLALELGGGGGGGSSPLGVECPDTGGNHLNFSAALGYTCGISNSGAGEAGNAAADGATKGLVAFPAARFTCASGICTLATTQAGLTLTNTTVLAIQDTNLQIQDDGDTSKVLKLNLVDIPPATTLTLKVPSFTTNDYLVTTTATQVLTNKELTAPAITSPVGILKSDVGLANVDNTSNATERAAVRTLTNATMSGAANTFANIPSTAVVFTDVSTGNASDTAHGYMQKFPGGTTDFLRADGTFAPPVAATPGGDCADSGGQHLNYTIAGGYSCGTTSSTGGSGGGDILSANSGTSVDGEVMLWSGSGGLTAKRASGTGIATLTGGQLGAAAGNSAGLRGVLSDETGTGLAVFNDTPTIATPIFSTSARTPLLIGGTGAASTLTLKSTSGTGTSDSIAFQVGDNGAVVAATIDTAGKVGIGTATPASILHVQGTTPVVRVQSASANQDVGVSFYNDTTRVGRFIYNGAGVEGARAITFFNDAADYMQFYSVLDTAIYFGTNSVQRMAISSAGLTSGFSGLTNPQFRVDWSATDVATGLGVTGKAAGTAPILATLSSGTNEGLDIDAKGSGDITLHRTSTGNLLFGGNTARTVALNRHTTSNTAGVNMTVQAGGATSGATDKNGGRLVLAPGLSTGTGQSPTVIQCAKPATATGTSDNTLVNCMVIGWGKRVADNVTTDTGISMTLASNTSVAVEVDYAIEVKDGANVQQVEAGRVLCTALNTAGVITKQCTKACTIQQLGAGTVTATWDITAANPAVVTVTVDSSLTPSTGFPLVSMNQIQNLTSQAMAVQ